jgi:N-acetylglucosamine kinase-like BadF-type ATPase
MTCTAIDHERRTHRVGGRDFRLTDLADEMVREVLMCLTGANGEDKLAGDFLEVLAIGLRQLVSRSRRKNYGRPRSFPKLRQAY